MKEQTNNNKEERTILITSFEPWGLVRKNISKEVSAEIKERLRKESFGLGLTKYEDKTEEGEGNNIKFITLPVNSEGIKSFKAFMKFERPDIVIHLGHIPMSNDFRIESSAHPKRDVMAEKLKGSLESDLARYIALRTGIKITNKIGTSYCNDIYYASLSAGIPSLFVHIGPKADMNFVLDSLIKIITKCKEVEL